MGVLSNTTVSGKNLTTVPKPVRNFLDVGVRVEWHVENVLRAERFSRVSFL